MVKLRVLSMWVLAVGLSCLVSCAWRGTGAAVADPSRAVTELVRGLNQTNPAAQLETVKQLATFGLAGVPGLAAAMTQQDGAVRQAAREALSRLPVETRAGAIVRGPKDRKRLALVFTGHEFAEGGASILDDLARHRAKASFFLTGVFLENPGFAPLLQRLLDEGHFLGPHSDQHLLYCAWETPPRTLVSTQAFAGDLQRNLEKARRWLNRAGAGARPIAYFLPPYEHYNEEIALWTRGLGLTLVNFTPGTRSNADYTGEADRNFVASQKIFDSILAKERQDPAGLNGYLLLLHIGAGPGRTDKFHLRFGELLTELAGRGYQFVRVDELLEL